jgi:hypothetical protein
MPDREVEHLPKVPNAALRCEPRWLLAKVSHATLYEGKSTVSMVRSKTGSWATVRPLPADRTSAATTMPANRLRLWFASFARGVVWFAMASACVAS